MLDCLFEDLGLQRLLPEQPMQLSHLALQGPVVRCRNDLLAAAGRRQGALRDEPAPGEQLVGGDPVPTGDQAHSSARFKGFLDHAHLLGGRRTEVMTSMRSEGLVIDTIVCLTLVKWETVSGRFGGYLIGTVWRKSQSW